MTKHCFIVTSAVNTEWGIYNNEIRFKQTIATLDSIHKYAPGSTIVIMECAAIPLTEWQLHLMSSKSHLIVDWTENDKVQEINKHSQDESILKNITEMSCFPGTITQCLPTDYLIGVDRIHKISGRYTLNEDFNLDIYENNQQIVIGPKLPSRLPFISTTVAFEYCCRLWSWPISMSTEIVKMYSDMLQFLIERRQTKYITSDGQEMHAYLDLEHLLYKYLDQSRLQSIPKIGIEGNLSFTGESVKD